MATTKQQQQQQQEPSAAEQPTVLTYRCPRHAGFFPAEDPHRPYTEFVCDPRTLRRLHDAACKRCVREGRRTYERSKSDWRKLPDLERVR